MLQYVQARMFISINRGYMHVNTKQDEQQSTLVLLKVSYLSKILFFLLTSSLQSIKLTYQLLKHLDNSL